MGDNKKAEETSLDPSFSLLWPEGRRTRVTEINEQSALDLGLQKLIEFMAFDAKHCEATLISVDAEKYRESLFFK
jgi:hypothetical protein